MESRLLGSLEAVEDGRPVDLPPGAVRAVLGMLLIRPNEVVSVDRLADGLWGAELPATAPNILQGYVSRLRKALGAGRVQTCPAGYMLTVEAEGIDAVRFERMLDEGTRARAQGDPQRAAEVLSQALSLWRSGPLADFTYAEWAQAEIARLRELRLTAVEESIEARLDLGHHSQLLAELDGLVVDHPLRERLWAARILALYRAGRQADALRAYQELRRHLAEELGIEPSSQLVALEAAVLGQDASLRWRPASPGASRLPVIRSSFVGRAAELRELEKLVQETGMVTVVGAGGIGKTRLAVEVARRLSSAYDDVRLVELGPLSDPALVVQQVARACGVRDEPGHALTETLAAALGPRRLLLVLDNCEHVLDATASLADALLRAAPELAILATSRQPLRIGGERVWHTPTLPVPPAGASSPEAALDFDAVRLFAARASDADERFTVGADNVFAIAEICRRLDGIPLALELAAARVSALTPSQVAARLGDRFRLLRGGSRAAPERHQTLRAAVQWSYDLCSPSEQALFRRLSVFAGGFTLEAAEGVCADDALPRQEVLELLSALVDRSLVMVQHQGDYVRYQMLETIRAYAEERLADAGEEKALKGRHLDWCLSLTEGAHGRLFGAGEAETLKELDGESANLRLALRRAVDSGVGDIALRLAIGLARLWEVRGHSVEARGWLESALSASQAAPGVLRARAMVAAAVLYLNDGNFPAASSLAEHAVKLARDDGDDVSAAEALECLHHVARAQGEFERAESLLDECMAAWRASGTVAGFVSSFAGALCSRGEWATASGLLREASAYYEEALAVATELGIDRTRSGCLFGLGRVAEAEGRLADARRFLDEATPISERLRDARPLEYQAYLRSLIAFDEGDLGEAAAGFRRTATGAATRGDRTLLIRAFEGIGRVVAEHGDLGRAAMLFGAAAVRREAAPWPVPPVDRNWYDAVVARLRNGLGDRPFETAWNRGGAMSTEELLHVAGADPPARLGASSVDHILEPSDENDAMSKLRP